LHVFSVITGIAVEQTENVREQAENAGELREQIEEQREQIKEHREQVEALKAELDKAERDKEDLKTTYNYYFLQVQTLINQRAIEAPGAKKPWWKIWQFSYFTNS
jgi:chromosome segregation ATPase